MSDSPSPAERAILDAITDGAEAWSGLEGLAAAGHEAGAIEGLIAAGLAERWEKAPGGPALTLTPWGERRLAVEIHERTAIVKEEITDYRSGRTMKVTAEDVVTYWGPQDYREPEDSTPMRRRPIHLPPRRHEYRLPFPELVPDPLPGPEFLIDEISERPVTLFAQLFDGRPVANKLPDGTPIAGIPVVIDRRMAGKR